MDGRTGTGVVEALSMMYAPSVHITSTDLPIHLWTSPFEIYMFRGEHKPSGRVGLTRNAGQETHICRLVLSVAIVQLSSKWIKPFHMEAAF